MASQHGGSSQARHESERYQHASASRWRHQESSAFHRHAVEEHGEARDPVTTASTGPLASFLNSDRVEADGDNADAGGQHQPIHVAPAPGQLDDGRGEAVAPDGREIVCGPLLNYRRMDENRWYGSVLIVVKGGGHKVIYEPSLTLRRVGKARQLAHGFDDANGANGQDGHETGQDTHVEARRLYSDRRVTFWAFDISVPLEPDEMKHEYQVPGMRISSEHKPRVNAFFVPAADESMRIMFHSCNGFSVGTDEDAYSGAPLWNDVMRKHARAPFHVMVGGGDQIYNDGIRVNGPLRAWTEIGNPKKRRDYPFPETLRARCDDYYLQNYIRWYDSKPFALANGQVPQLNIWDDHDVSLQADRVEPPIDPIAWQIIDGFGSYVDHFMRCDVFRGIGGIAHKYYMLFQQHMAPPPSTYTSGEHRPCRSGLDGYMICADPARPPRLGRRGPGPRPAPARRHLCGRAETGPAVHCWNGAGTVRGRALVQHVLASRRSRRPRRHRRADRGKHRGKRPVCLAKMGDSARGIRSTIPRRTTSSSRDCAVNWARLQAPRGPSST